MSGVELSVASPQERHILENLFQLYTHDFSEFWSGLPTGELQSDGRFSPYGPLDTYWREDDRIPLLVRQDGHLAGFALLNRISHIGQSVDRNMAEFFIVRKHRRGGLGSAVATMIYSNYPGIWETAVARRNTGALAFWQRVISRHPKIRDLEKSDQQTEAWNGPLFRFRVDA